MAQEPDRATLDPATRARLETIRASLQFTLQDKNRLIAIREDHLGEALDIADALLAECARAAPVLAAADRADTIATQIDVEPDLHVAVSLVSDYQKAWADVRQAVATWRAAHAAAGAGGRRWGGGGGDAAV